jgi:hypothetical protein
MLCFKEMDVFLEGRIRIVRLDPDSDLAKSRKKDAWYKFKNVSRVLFKYQLSRIPVNCVLSLPVLTPPVQAINEQAFDIF